MKYALLVAATMLAASPALAAPNHTNNGHHNGWSNPHNPHSSAPAPLLGAGLPALLMAAGAVGAWRMRRKGDK